MTMAASPVAHRRPPSSAMRSLAAGACLATSLLLEDGRAIFCAGRSNRADRRRRQRRHRGRGASTRRPTDDRFVGSSSPKITSAFPRVADDEPASSSSYFERNGLDPPPLISRADSRRALMGESPSDEAETGLFFQALDDDASRVTSGKLEPLIRDSKNGEDVNARLRRDLLSGGTSFDKHSYPWEYIWHNQTTATGKLTGLPVEMNVNFHRVSSVDIVNSVMDLSVWLRLVWVDPRLTWEPEEYGNLTKTRFWIGEGGAGGETSEIWTPDIKLWNLVDGLTGSLEDSYAEIRHDGVVFWSRPGHLNPACTFSGLRSFPFDKLTCSVEFGSWSYSGKYLRMEKYGGVGFSLGGSMTAGESYQQYSFAKKDPIKCTKRIESASEDDWPVLLYNITISRSWQPYLRGYILTQVILNGVGFSAFWLPPSCGERMNLSVMSMLAAQTADIVVAEKLPMAAEYTWFAKFSLLSTSFAFLSLLECVVVLYFYYKRNEDTVPHYCMQAKDWCLGKQTKRDSESSGAVTRTTNLSTLSLNTALHTGMKTRKTRQITFSMAEISDTSGRSDCAEEEDSLDETRHFSIATNDVNDDWHDDVANDEDVPGEAQFRNFTFSEHLRQESGKIPSRSLMLRDFKDRFVKTNRYAGDANDFANEEEVVNNMRWKLVAARIDDVARFWIPLSFIISLSIIFAEVF